MSPKRSASAIGGVGVGRRRCGRPGLWPQAAAAATLAAAGLVGGYSAAYTSPALASMADEAASASASASMAAPDAGQASWIASLMPLNAAVGGLVGGAAVERFGRKYTVLATGPLFIVSWLVIALAPDVTAVYAGRSLQGAGVGAATLALALYAAEALEPAVRGSLGLAPATAGNAGILLCCALGRRLDWRRLAAVAALLPVLLLVGAPFLVETPRWLVSKGRREEARASLQWLRGAGADVDVELARLEADHDERSTKRSASYTRPLLVALGLAFFQQASGINAVVFYAERIFRRSAGTVDAGLASTLVASANAAATLVSNLVVDRVGRRPLLCASGTVAAASLAVLGASFYLQHLKKTPPWGGWLPLAALVVYTAAFSLGLGPVPSLVVAEVLPAGARGWGAATATAFNWGCSFAVTKAFPDLIEALSAHGTFWLFAALCLCGAAFSALLVPETAGRSLEDIERDGFLKKASSQPQTQDGIL